MQKTCIIIAGPTAIGKTALSVQLAKELSAEIISADSRQCYRELSIGVAKPSVDELNSVRHFFINSHSIHEEVTAAGFEEYALSAIHNIFERTDTAIMVGGTGLYIRAFAKGLDAVPAVDPSVREEIMRSYKIYGISWLQDQLQIHDPQFFRHAEIMNPQRSMRALEVVLSSGQSILTFQKQQTKERPFRIIQVRLEMPREDLYDRINKRVDAMMQDGLLAEVRGLLPYQHLNALQTVGYRELFSYLNQPEPENNPSSLEKNVELIKQHTRQYAKRQLTWFRKEADMRSCYPDQEELSRLIRQII